MHNALKQWAKEHGPIFKFFMGRYAMLVVSGALQYLMADERHLWFWTVTGLRKSHGCWCVMLQIRN